MLNNAAAVNDTQLEDARNSESIAYYDYLLSLELHDCPVKFNITSEQSAALQKGITDLKNIQELLQAHYDKDRLYTYEGMNAVIKAIHANSQEYGTCYLPSGWTGEPGHFAGLKLRRLENGHYAFSILNHGDGMVYHRKVSGNEGGKEKYIYQSDEYDIDLKTNNGRELLQKILELQFDKKRENDPRKFVNAYCADDLYGLLKLYGKEIPLTDKLSEKVVTPQRGGTCSVTNLHAIARDILVDHGADLKTRKRYHFILKLRSILVAFDDYQKRRCPRNVLEWANREFAVRLNKEYRHTLTDEEMIYCGQLEAKIKARLAQDKELEIQQQCLAMPLPNSEGQAPSYQEALFHKAEKKSTEDVFYGMRKQGSLLGQSR